MGRLGNMEPTSKFVSAGVLAVALASPFATIGVLAIVARLRKADLRQALPWLRALRWVAWLAGLTFTFVAWALHQRSFYFPIGLSMIITSAGWGISEQWVKRRHASD